ncbi:MAG: glucose-1-phosphate adenylyltransferase [Nitrosomonas sp.]|nr:glucose-1-phosphate adenylyltransferase [Nitrosomonas sp.]
MSSDLQIERNISTATANTLALVLAGGQGSRLKNLTKWRAKPAVPFGGKFRIIDFPMSNCINSGIRRISILTQYKSHSLQCHLQRGWSFLSSQFGEFAEVLAAQQRSGDSWYQGTADAVYQNLDIIRHHNPEFVIILAGDHIYKMDYGKMIADHMQNNADITVGCLPVPLNEASGFGVMAIDNDMKIIEFEEKPEHPKSIPNDEKHALGSMGIYVFSVTFLREILIRDHNNKQSSHDFGKDIIPGSIHTANVRAFRFRNANTGTPGYWRDVGTIDAYWEANINLAELEPELNLYDKNWPICTYQDQTPPAKFSFNDNDRRGMATDSLVSGGCLITGGRVDHSILFANVRVHSYSEVIDSVVLSDVVINRNCKIRKCVIDKGTIVPENTTIGYDAEADKSRFHVSEKGVTLVTAEMLGQKLHEL